MLHRGRIAKSLEIRSIGELTRDDLACLKESRSLPAVEKIRDTHHRLARLIATGLKINEAAGLAGFSIARAYVLHIDPSFQDLVAAYRKDVNAEFVSSQVDFEDLARTNMLKAERQIADKLDAADDAGETLPTRELISISRDAADRFGYGKKTTNTNVNVNFAANLEGAMRRSSKVIDHHPQIVRRI